MSAAPLYDRFIETLAIWEKSLPAYSEQEWAYKPDEDSWSIGQLYQHLAMTGLFFLLPNAEKCLNSAENADKTKNEDGERVYRDGALPATKIKMPQGLSSTTVQPEGIEPIVRALEKLKTRMRAFIPRLDAATSSGKTQHPYLGYLDAREWYQFGEIHFRHHLMQKAKLEEMMKEAVGR